MVSRVTESMVERYGVYWVNLDPVRGKEIAKSRPAVVVSDDRMNSLLGTVVVCPLTTRLHDRWPSRVRTDATGRPAEVAIDQIRTVSKSRLGKKLGSVSDEEAQEIRHVITAMYGVLAG